MEISRKYSVIEKVGQGGMGVVYKVRHMTLDTTLALKVLPRDFSENPEMLTRFHREARLMARLKHPNIVQVLDVDRDETLNFHYFVMEYIHGLTLRQYLREKKRLPLAEVLRIAVQVAKALTYAHAQVPSVIHRDIKPANIMIEETSGRVVVMDFGIAKEIGQSDATRTGAIIGTMKYCAPEQIRREPIDGAADLYALGMVIYETYTGKQFFAGLDETKIVGKVLYEPQEHVADFSPETPPVFTALVTKAIAKSREQRYHTAEQLLHDLEQCRAALAAGTLDQLTLPGLTAVSTPPVPSELEVIEQRLHRLKGERDQRLATTLRQEVQQAHDRAVTVAASQWAQTLWQQAVAHEERGQQCWQRCDYQQAAEAYQTALSFFTQAYEVAQTLVTLQQTGQSPTAGETSHGEAEPRGTQELASSSQRLSSRTDEVGTPSLTAPSAQEHEIEEDRWEIGEEKILPSPSSVPQGTPSSQWFRFILLGLGGVGVVGLLVWWLGLFSMTPSRALVFTRVEPQEERPQITEGAVLSFAAEVGGTPPFRYTWELEGQVVSQEEHWVYRPVNDEGRGEPQRVRLQIVDAHGQQVEKTWHVTVSRTNQPPQLRAFTPTPEVVTVAHGTSQMFAVEAHDPEGELLRYGWTVDGVTVGTDPSFSWKIQSEGTYRLRAEVRDQKGLTASHEWHVAVLALSKSSEPEEKPAAPNTPPQMTAALPENGIVVTPEGEMVMFSTSVSDPEGDALSYEWLLDGKKVPRDGASPTFKWKAKGAGNHQVRAVVRDQGGLTVSKEWHVAVLASSEPAPSPTIPEPPSSPSQKNTPPQIIVRVPDEETVKMVEGATVTLSATASDPDGEELAYEWLLNGKKVASDATFAFTADSLGVRRIEVKVTDPRGGKVSNRWNIQVGARPPTPQLVMFTPHESRHALYDHLSRFFGVEVEVPGVVEPELRYEWKINGKPVEGKEILEFKNQPIGTHRVEVAVISATGERVTHQWSVYVRPDEADRPSIWAPRLEILDLNNEPSKDKKMIMVTGVVRNIDEVRTADNVIIWVSAMGAQGETIARKLTLPSPQPLAPGQVAPFRVQFANHKEMSDFRVEVVSK